MCSKCLAQGHSILMQPGFESSIFVSIDRLLTYMTDMLQYVFLYIYVNRLMPVNQGQFTFQIDGVIM